LRLHVVGLAAAFDMAEMIIRNTKTEPDWYIENTGPKQKAEKFPGNVLDAWSNISMLQDEIGANKLSKSLVDMMDALQAGEMNQDDFNTNVKNAATAMNTLVFTDKSNRAEMDLSVALSGLAMVNDPEALNGAMRETKSQLHNLSVTEKEVDALKLFYEALNAYIAEQTEGQDHTETRKVLRGLIDEHSQIVIHLAALEANPSAMRATCVMAQRCMDNEVDHDIIKLLLSHVVKPEIMLNCSAPKSEDLQALMVAMNEIVIEQQAASTVKTQVAGQLKATEGGKKVAEVRASHRRRLAYRARLAVKKRATEVIELRAAEKTGAEWDGFQVEAVGLKAAAVENLSPVEKAFRSFDRDGDGDITIDEVIEYLLSVGPEERPEGLKDVNPFKKGKMKKKLQKMDTDGDGKLSFIEFDSWWTANNGTEGEI
jgi:hypothetical protein